MRSFSTLCASRPNPLRYIKGMYNQSMSSIGLPYPLFSRSLTVRLHHLI